MKTPIEILQETGARFHSPEDFDYALDILTGYIAEIRNEKITDVTKLQSNVLFWAFEKNLLPHLPHNRKDISFKQYTKLIEEIGELANAMIRGDEEGLIDAFGDVQVVLIILAEQLYVNYNHALDVAWNTIKHRKGVTVDGVFIKDK